MFPIDYYQVRQRAAWYGRTWRAEWEGVQWCPRAYTHRGIVRKAHRWVRKGYPTDGMVARRRWWRRNVTRRSAIKGDET